MQPRDAGLERRMVAGPRKDDAAHVMVEIDTLVLDPDRARELDRQSREPAPEDRREMEPAPDVAPRAGQEIDAAARRRLVEMDRADVHRRLGRFEIEERRVEAGKRLHRVSIAFSSCGSRRCGSAARLCGQPSSYPAVPMLASAVSPTRSVQGSRDPQSRAMATPSTAGGPTTTARDGAGSSARARRCRCIVAKRPRCRLSCSREADFRGIRCRPTPIIGCHHVAGRCTLGAAIDRSPQLRRD